MIRKYVVLFGSLFNNISLIRTNKDTGSEIERIKVPIIYAPKEKYIARLFSDPDLQREIQVVLPRMSFEMTGISYDASRKQNSLLKNPTGVITNTASNQYVGVPYDLTFELNLYTRNIDDGTHVVEQILPYFNPDYTPTINPLTQMGFNKDTPIIMNTVTNNIEHEGNFDAVRYVTWTLTFTMKAYFYGPITTSKIIRKVDVNIFNDPSLQSGYITRMNMTSGNGVYKIDDTVYQGPSYQTATAYGIVISWDDTNKKLSIGGTQGQFSTNNVVHSASTNAAYVLQSFDASALKLVNIHVEPKPNTANPGDDFGYDTTITEFM